MAKRTSILFWIFYPLLTLLAFAFVLFYFDLANGPLVLFILELIALALSATFRFLLRKRKFLFRSIPTFAFILVTVLLVSLSGPTTERKSAVNFSSPVSTEVLSLANGDIKGVYSQDQKVEVYTGIPYAKAPVGDLRWKEPQDPENWDGVKDCSYFAPRAMQKDGNAVMSSLVDIYSAKGWYPDYNMTPRQDMSEDCLYLNIWKPHTEEKNLPILFYIHGGSLTSGTTGFDDYNGEEMARHGVIFINVAYRLGIFGFFANEELKAESPNHTTGNYGLLDQIKALEWVNKNAEYFNGDKNNITIAGESAGSSCVSALCTSPLSKGLFKRAIGESSSLAIKNPPHTFRSVDYAYKADKKIMEEYKCSTIAEMRKIKAEDLVKTSLAPQQVMVDGYVLEKQPYEVYQEKNNNEEILLNGFNVKEADAFVVPKFLFSPTNKDNIQERLAAYFNQDLADKLVKVYEKEIQEDAFTTFNEIISVFWFMNPHHEWCRIALDAGVKVYSYQFTKENKYHGNYHAGELIYAYGNVRRDKHTVRYDESDALLSDKMVTYWSNFAKTGDPNSAGLPTWNPYSVEKNNLLEFNNEVKEITDPYLKTYPIIQEYMDSLETN